MIDLVQETQRLRLDMLAVEVSSALSTAHVPHAVIKGVTTARWLYDPPRSYRDVDVLIPSTGASAALRALIGIAEPHSGRVGEEAPHSLILHSADGFEVDVHISLPTLPPAGDCLWNAFAPHVKMMTLDVGSIPVLDEPARCLVLALHALSGPSSPQPVEDLRRAREATAPAAWDRVRQLAQQIGADDLLEAGLSLTGPPVRSLTRRAYLHAHQAPPASLGLQRLAEARRRDLPGMILREVVPSAGFMRYAHPDLLGTRFWLVRAHARRWRTLRKQLPLALRVWRAAGRETSKEAKVIRP